MTKDILRAATLLLCLACKEAPRQEGARSGAVASQGFIASPKAMPMAAIATDQVVEQPEAMPGSGVESGARGETILIRTGSAQIEVKNVEQAATQVRQMAKALGGVVANSSASGGRNETKSATLELKIPSNRFDEAAGGLGVLGNVEAVNVTAQDVGEEFADLEARANNARRLEVRLIDLLATRTGKLEDVLAVERELARVREAIERMEGRQKYLKAHSAMSTLTVTVHERLPVVGNAPGENPLAQALRRAWRNFVGLLAGIIAASGILIPIGLITWLAWLFWRRKLKAKK